jgi:hypothetical protein
MFLQSFRNSSFHEKIVNFLRQIWSNSENFRESSGYDRVDIYVCAWRVKERCVDLADNIWGTERSGGEVRKEIDRQMNPV